MKLIKTAEQKQIGPCLNPYREWWDLGDGYEIYISFGRENCSLGIRAPNKNITYDLAPYLEIDTNLVPWKEIENTNQELFLITGIDCATLIYRKPENYKVLLEKIEGIVNEYFKKNDKNLISENED